MKQLAYGRINENKQVLQMSREERLDLISQITALRFCLDKGEVRKWMDREGIATLREVIKRSGDLEGFLQSILKGVG